MDNKNIFSKLILLLVTLLILGILKYWIQYSAPQLVYSEKIDNYTSSNTVNTFTNINLSNDNQFVVGLYFNNSKYIKKNQMSFKTDGNYTIEYYVDNKLVRKTLYNKYYYQIGFSSSQGKYHRLPMDKINIPQDINSTTITIKLITHKPFSFLQTLYKKGEEVDFFVIKRSKKVVQDIEKMQQSYKQYLQNSPKTYFKIPFTANDKEPKKISLLKALIAKDFKKVKQIIEEDNGLDVNTTLEYVKTDLIRYRKPKKRIPLLYAAYFNDIKTLKYLIKKGSNLYHKDYQDQNALGYAIQNGSLEAAKLLLDAGVKVSDVSYVITKKGDTTSPLIAAVANNSYEMTKLLLEHGAKNESPSEKIASYKYGVYHYLGEVEDHKRILRLLLKYDIQSLKGRHSSGKATEKDLRRVYDGCTKGTAATCGPITRDFKWEDMDIYIYYEIKYLDR